MTPRTIDRIVLVIVTLSAIGGLITWRDVKQQSERRR